MEIGARQLVMLRIMAKRFKDMGEAYPKEYTDELEAASLPGQRDPVVMINVWRKPVYKTTSS